MTGPVAFVLKGYPRLSETFIAQEIHALESRGLDILIVSLRFPTDRDVHPVHREIKARVLYLPEYLYQEPRRVWRAWRAVRQTPRYVAVKKMWLRDLWRDRTPNRIRRFGQALVLAHELPDSITRLHAHFLHTPASVTRYAAHLRGLPWSGSAHAKDVWTIPDWEKREKLADCGWLVTCTAANYAHLATLAPGKDTVGLCYHGLDLRRFPATAPVRPPRDGSNAADPVILLSVGRAVAKKGYGDLLAALTKMPPDLHWRFVHVGGGALRKTLKEDAVRLGLAGRITWLGAKPQDDVIAQYRAADLFVLASRIADDGDRDGLPNVLMEAQACALACLSTRVSAIPELIADGDTGRLVPPDEPAALAGALEGLIRQPAERARLGLAGQARVRQAFGMDTGIDQLAARFGLDTSRAPK